MVGILSTRRSSTCATGGWPSPTVWAGRQKPDKIEPGRDALVIGDSLSQVRGLVRVLERRGDYFVVAPLTAWIAEVRHLSAPCFYVRRSLVAQPPLEDTAVLREALDEWVVANDLGAPDVDSTTAHEGSAAVCVGTPIRLMFAEDAETHGLYELDLENGLARGIGDAGVRWANVGLAHDRARDVLIGSSAWEPLLRISPDGSQSEEFGHVGAEGLAIDNEGQVVYASLNDRFFTLDPVTGDVIEELEAPWTDANCLAFDRFSRTVYAIADRSLHAYDVEEREWRLVLGLPSTAQFCGLAFNPTNGRLFAGGFDDDQHILWEIDPDNGALREIGRSDVALAGGLAIITY